MANASGFRITARLVLGLAVLVVGGLLVLDRLGIVSAEPLRPYWPVAIILIGLVNLFSRGREGGRGVGLVLIFLGVWLLARSLGYTELSWHEVWPVLLVLLGALMIWREVSRHLRRPAGGGDSSAEVAPIAILGGANARTATREFRGGSATAVMGGCEIDLRQASIATGEAAIDIFAFWGGVEIFVPETWEVVVRALGIMGGIEDKTAHPPGDSNPRLVITGLAIMGGCEIKNRPRRAE